MPTAICYFGLTRSVKECHSSHHENIHKVLEACGEPYDIFLHTWELPDGIQKVWNRVQNARIDYDEYKLLNPKYFKRDKQEDFLKTLDFDKYYYKDQAQLYGQSGRGEWIPDLVRNHLCALESQRRVFEMVQQTQKTQHETQKYDTVLIVRPDSLITSFFPYESVNKFLKENEKGIVIPEFDKFEGYNDRFAVLNYASAEKYCSRINEIAEFRKTHGRITSEKYVKYICDMYYDKVLLIKFFFQLKRP